jgi:hypothetical protein
MPPGISGNHPGLLAYVGGTRPTFMWDAPSRASGACADHQQASTRDIDCRTVEVGRALHPMNGASRSVTRSGAGNRHGFEEGADAATPPSQMRHGR